MIKLTCYPVKNKYIADAHEINVIFNGAGVATPDPGEAPPMAGFCMRLRFRHRTVLEISYNISRIKYINMLL
ncbi:MAG: hypothetical protein Q8M95_09915 [Candidatus Methanoperedens sp.]|nr:hypothetical protein [Candidatus Methanoperedens sp.]